VAVRRIVVGVDGSEHALAALRWAASERALRGAELWAVLAWQMPPAGLLPLDEEPWRQAAEQMLRESVTAVFGADPSATVHPLLRYGAAAPTVLNAAAEFDADLLVVGSRGHGGVAGLLLGSVSTACVHRAGCPVLVVRPPQRSKDRTHE